MNAVREHGGPALDFAAAAKALGVSEAALRAALPPPPTTIVMADTEWSGGRPSEHDARPWCLSDISYGSAF